MQVLFVLILLLNGYTTFIDQFEIIAIIHENMEANEVEDIDRVMYTIDSAAPVYEGTRTVTLQLFDAYDLNYEMKDVRIIAYNGETADVDFVLVTTKISGGPFRNNRVAGTNFLRKTDSGWKIYNTVISDIEYLDETDGFDY